MKPSRFYLIITALLLIVVGVVCILHPGDGFQAMAWLVGLLVMLAGISTLLFGLRGKGKLPNSSMTTFLGLFELVVGILFLVNSVLASTTLVVVFALWVLFEGISLAVLSFDYRKAKYDRWWLMLLLGICGVALGFLAMCHPEGAGAFLGILLGLGIFANGVVRLVAFVALRRIDKQIRDIKESAAAIDITDKQ